MTRRRRVAIFALLSSVTFVTILAVLEGGARLIGFQGKAARRYSWLRKPDPVLGWVYKPDSRFPIDSSPGVIHGSTDGEGFRPLLGRANDSESPVILCLGDSFTFGAESPDDRTWPECLSRALAERGRPCRVLNRGVTGYSPLQSLLVLRQTLARDPRAEKIRAVVFLYCFNDPMENFEEDRPHFESGGQAKILPPATFHPERSPSLLRKIRVHSAFLNAIRPDAADSSTEAFRAGAKGNADYFSPMIQQFLSKEYLQEGMRHAFRELKKECESRGLPLLVASGVVSALDDPVARREFVELVGWSASQAEGQLAAYLASFRLVRRLVEECGATYVDVQGCLGGLSYRDSVASSDNWHYSAATNERIGNALAGRLLDQGVK